MCNELDDRPVGSVGPTGKKSRYVMGVSTPAHPMIFNSATEGCGSSGEFYAEGMPLVGEEASGGRCGNQGGVRGPKTKGGRFGA